MSDFADDGPQSNWDVERDDDVIDREKVARLERDAQQANFELAARFSESEERHKQKVASNGGDPSRILSIGDPIPGQTSVDAVGGFDANDPFLKANPIEGTDQ